MTNCYEIYRRKAKLKQKDVAQKLGITQGAVSQWEKGVSKPRAELLPKIAALYECTIDELLTKDNTQDSA